MFALPYIIYIVHSSNMATVRKSVAVATVTYCKTPKVDLIIGLFEKHFVVIFCRLRNKTMEAVY
jgi:hypothetical protein